MFGLGELSTLGAKTLRSRRGPKVIDLVSSEWLRENRVNVPSPSKHAAYSLDLVGTRFVRSPYLPADARAETRN